MGYPRSNPKKTPRANKTTASRALIFVPGRFVVTSQGAVLQNAASYMLHTMATAAMNQKIQRAEIGFHTA
jgi:hypothetical protein